MRFVGEYEQKIDDKGRVVLPSAFRNELENVKLMLSLGDHGEIGIWPIEEWDRRAAEKQLHEYESDGAAREFREFTRNAHEVKLDGQFRFAISETLRRKGGFSEVGASQPLVIIGARNRLEIWEKSRHTNQFERD